MAAAGHPLPLAFSGLFICLGRPPVLPRNRDECAELLQALVTWATPGPEDGSQKKVPARAAAALLASLLLLEALRAKTRGGGHVTCAGTAKAERELTSENAEESGKSPTSSLLVEDETGGVGPKGKILSWDETNVAPSPEKTDVALNSPNNSDGVPISADKSSVAPASSEKTDVALKSPNNSDGVPTSADKSSVAPASSEKTDVASPGDIDEDGEVKVGSDKEPGSGVIDLECILPCATAPLLLLCGAHIQDTPWSDSQSRRLAHQLLRSLLAASQCTSVGELLKGHQEQPYKTFREALGLLGPRLRKDTWESHPDARLVFAWMLFRVPRPWLSDFLSRVMPPSLLFSDDYKPENKVLGIRCLHHIIKNVPAAELRQYNRALVVYHALRNHLHTTDAEVIEAVLPCLLDLFPVLHKPPPALGAYQKDGENPSDQVMQLVLTHMEMEHKMVLRRLYAQNLPALQERLGVGIVRHMKRLLCVIVGYLEVSDGPEETARLSVLETLQGTIKHAWPRIPPRLPLLLKALVKLIYELSSASNPNSVPVTEALLNGASECLLLLDKCCKGQVKTALQDLPLLCAEPLLLKHITRVLHKT